MNPMPSSRLVVTALAAALSLAACSRPTDATAQNFTAALKGYLAQRGDLCLGKSTWPIDVTQREIESNARNAVQMPVLEKLGLVSASVAEVDLTDDDGEAHHLKVRRYALTETGRRFYIVRDAVRADGGKAPQGNLCAARLSLDKVVRWNADPAAPAGQRMVITYTYQAEPAPWMNDAEAQRVFPVVANVLRGSGHAELTQAFRLTDSGWVAADL